MTKRKTKTAKPKKKTKPARAKSAKPKKEKKYFHRECHLCLANIEDGLDHVCVPLTERELFRDLPEDLQDAFQTLRQRASNMGEQKIYNNARAVMFSRKVCYMFARPKKSFIELCFFLPRQEKSSIIKNVKAVSKTKYAHTMNLVHSDQVEAPLTGWLKEAFDYGG